MAEIPFTGRVFVAAGDFDKENSRFDMVLLVQRADYTFHRIPIKGSARMVRYNIGTALGELTSSLKDGRFYVSPNSNGIESEFYWLCGSFPGKSKE